MINKDWYLIQYREAIRSGEIIAGRELIKELDRLIEDLDNPRYIYDTASAYERMDFMENCVRLTKAPFYNKPMVLMFPRQEFYKCLVLLLFYSFFFLLSCIFSNFHFFKSKISFFNFLREKGLVASTLHI